MSDRDYQRLLVKPTVNEKNFREISKTQCGNQRNFLSFRFYMKSNHTIFVLKLQEFRAPKIAKIRTSAKSKKVYLKVNWRICFTCYFSSVLDYSFSVLQKFREIKHCLKSPRFLFCKNFVKSKILYTFYKECLELYFWRGQLAGFFSNVNFRTFG